jgi:hypothetical protein
VGCPWVGENESKNEQKWEVNKNLSIVNFYTKICLSEVVVSQHDMCYSYFGPYLEIKMFMRLGQVSMCIVAFVGRGLATHMN